MIDKKPKICPFCGSEVKFGSMDEFGIRNFESGYCYICTNCGAYTGTSKKSPFEALGTLADKETRRLRGECHNEFKKHHMTSYGKSLVYYKLSKELNIPYEECHFGYMDKNMLRKSLDIMKNWGEDVYFK